MKERVSQEAAHAAATVCGRVAEWEVAAQPANPAIPPVCTAGPAVREKACAGAHQKCAAGPVLELLVEVFFAVLDLGRRGHGSCSVRMRTEGYKQAHSRRTSGACVREARCATAGTNSFKLATNWPPRRTCRVREPC